MGDVTAKWKDNVQGKLYTDEECIQCDACVLTAPDNFKMNDEDGHALVCKQPESPEEWDLCREAMDGCPVEAIGDDGEI